ncbi:MAG: hypothetical protein C4294_10420, partial [Nitrospiraceae bacterium]
MIEATDQGLIERWTWNAELGETLRLTRLAAIHSSRESEHPDEAAGRHLSRALDEGIDPIVRSHVEAWSRRWDTADLKVVGDK